MISEDDNAFDLLELLKLNDCISVHSTSAESCNVKVTESFLLSLKKDDSNDFLSFDDILHKRNNDNVVETNVLTAILSNCSKITNKKSFDNKQECFGIEKNSNILSSLNSIDYEFDKTNSNVNHKDISYGDTSLFKQSLFSKAISAKPRVNVERLKKLRLVKKLFLISSLQLNKLIKQDKLY